MKEKKAWTIRQIITHIKPHVDELVAIFLLQLFGEKLFPKIGKAEINFLSNRKITNGDDFLKDGTLFVGMGKGMFDEHGKEGKTETAATLVAKYLGIADNPKVKFLLDYTINVDAKSNGHPYDLANMLKDFFQNAKNIGEEMDAFNWAMRAIRAKFNNQEKISDFSNLEKCIDEFGNEINQEHCAHVKNYVERIQKGTDRRTFGLAVITEVMCQKNFDDGLEWLFYAVEIKIADRKMYLQALRAFMEKAQRHLIQCGKQRIKVAIVKSDNHKMNKVFRTRKAGNYDILIQKGLSGNIAIYTNIKSHIKMDVVAEIIRSIEMTMDGKKVPEDYHYLQSDGVIKEVPQWYYLKRGNMLLNGSLTAKQPPTQLSSDEILEIIKIAFDFHFLPAKCRKSKKCAFENCIFYCLHMDRCYNLRKKIRSGHQGKVLPFPKNAKTG